MRSPATLLNGIVLLACAGLLAACQGDPVGPTQGDAASLSADLGASFAVGGGNSSAAHLCKDGGFANLFREDGSQFANTGDCVSYAAHGGKFTRPVTFSNISLGACNNISFGYTVGGVSTDVYNKPYDCAPFHTYGDVTIFVPLGSTVEVYLKDNTCGSTFTQNSAHASVTGTNPQHIAIADAGGFCESTSPSDPRVPTGGLGNLNVDVTYP